MSRNWLVRAPGPDGRYTPTGLTHNEKPLYRRAYDEHGVLPPASWLYLYWFVLGMPDEACWAIGKDPNDGVPLRLGTVNEEDPALCTWTDGNGNPVPGMNLTSSP